MRKEVGAIIIGVGLEVIFLVLSTQVKEMPAGIAIAGYTVGGSLIFYGIVCTLIPLRSIWNTIIAIRIRSPLFIENHKKEANRVSNVRNRDAQNVLQHIVIDPLAS